MAKKDTIWAVLAGRPTDRFVHFEDCAMVFTPGERNVGGDQQPDGTVKVPDVLVKYMGCEYIGK